MPPALLRLLARRGKDARAIARHAGLPPGSEGLEEVALTHEDFEHLLAGAAAALGDPLLALHLPELLEWPSYHVAELAARASPTLREAFQRVTRYASLFYGPLAFACADRGDDFLVTQRLRGSTPGGRYGNEYALGSTLFYARRLSGVLVVPRAVSFAHAAPAEAELVREHFGGARLSFGARANELVFLRRDAERPSVARDARLLATAERLADHALEKTPEVDDFVAVVWAEVSARISDGAVDARSLARRLRVSPRTLQRRLDACGTNLRAIVAEVRRETALAALREGSVSLSEVAERAGFSDAATLTRAVRRWTGRAPGAYRRALGERD